MTRVIKFRQPIFNHGEFVKWHYWGFVNDGEFTGVIPPIDEAAKNSQQFTGLMDSKGKEIYGKDVIKWGHNINTLGPNLGVCFDGGFAEGIGVVDIGPFGVSVGDKLLYDFSEHLEGPLDKPIEEFEVIGNIYQNPDLVAVK